MINSKKTGVISNIILSIFYACFAWIPSVFGLVPFLMASKPLSVLSVYDVFFLATFALITGTLLFAVLGIVLSVILRRLGKYTASFVIQFLPFFTLGMSLFTLFISMFLDGYA